VPKKTSRKKVPSTETLQRRRDEKWASQISCCKCHLIMDISLWAEHLTEPCFSWTLTPAQVRAAKKAFKKQRANGDSHNGSHLETTLVRKTPCARCGRTLSAMAMEIHIGTCNKTRAALSTDGFPFVLLPQSISDDLRTEIKRYFLNEQASSLRLANCDWDWSRLDELELLNPKMAHFGRKGWFGYCVFEFPDTHRVVLETPATEKCHVRRRSELERANITH
jgi:hypothetical protein